MKKLSVVLVIISIFNFIICSFSFAAPEDVDASSFDISSIYQADEEGTVEIEGNKKEINVTQSTVGSIAGIIMTPVTNVAGSVSAAGSIITALCGFYRTESEFGADKDGMLKVSSVVFGEYLLVDPIITKTSTNLNPHVEPTKVIEMVDRMKNLCISLFFFIRAIAVCIFILLILYSVIRLTVSSTAADRAKFKALIRDWFIGLLFSFGVKYIFIVLNTVFDILMSILWNARIALENSGFSSFEFVFYEDLWETLIESSGMQIVGYGILFVCLVCITIKFLIKYLIRSLKVSFLVAISPIIGVVYTFQKAGSIAESEAIGKWISSYCMNLFIQPIHALLYLVFMFSASEIAVNAPFLGIIFLWALGRSEKVVKAMLGINEKVYALGK